MDAPPAPRAWLGRRGASGQRLPINWPTIPWIRAIQARAAAIAPAMLRISAPTLTPIAAKAAFQAMPPPMVAHIAVSLQARTRPCPTTMRP